MLDLGFLMGDPDFCSDLILERTRITGRDYGRPIYGDVTQRNIKGVIQPLTAQDLVSLANSANGNTTEGLVLFTLDTLTTGTDEYRADRIVFEGVVYDVMQVEDFKPNGNYCRSVLQRTHDELQSTTGNCQMFRQ